MARVKRTIVGDAVELVVKIEALKAQLSEIRDLAHKAFLRHKGMSGRGYFRSVREEAWSAICGFDEDLDYGVGKIARGEA